MKVKENLFILFLGTKWHTHTLGDPPTLIVDFVCLFGTKKKEHLPTHHSLGHYIFFSNKMCEFFSKEKKNN